MDDLKQSGGVTAESARELLAKREAVAIDLRAEEIAETGRVPGAVAAIDGDVLDAADRARRGDELPVLVLGDGDEEAEEAVKELRDAGIEAAAVRGGWQEWVGTGQPTQPKTENEFEGPDLSKPPGT